MVQNSHAERERHRPSCPGGRGGAGWCGGLRECGRAQRLGALTFCELLWYVFVADSINRQKVKVDHVLDHRNSRNPFKMI